MDIFIDVLLNFSPQQAVLTTLAYWLIGSYLSCKVIAGYQDDSKRMLFAVGWPFILCGVIIITGFLVIICLPLYMKEWGV